MKNSFKQNESSRQLNLAASIYLEQRGTRYSARIQRRDLRGKGFK